MGRLQIISQNYVVWNVEKSKNQAWFDELQIISQNYVVWNPPSRICLALPLMLQIISQNYVVWNSPPELEPPEPSPVANYITKLRGLKPKKGIALIR